MNTKMKFGECWEGKFAEIAKLIENGIKCSGWHMAATGSAHFGKCIDFTFDYIPNFNVTIYYNTTVARIPTTLGMGNVVGWADQYIVMSNKRELFRFKTDVSAGDNEIQEL